MAAGIRTGKVVNVSYICYEGTDPNYICVDVPPGVQAQVWVDQDGMLRIEGPRSTVVGDVNLQIGMVRGDVTSDSPVHVQAGRIEGNVVIGAPKGWLWRVWRFFFGRKKPPHGYIIVTVPAGHHMNWENTIS